MKSFKTIVAIGTLLLSSTVFAKSGNGALYGDIGVSIEPNAGVYLALGKKFKDNFRLELQTIPYLFNQNLNLGVAAYYDYHVNTRWSLFGGIGGAFNFYYGSNSSKDHFKARFQFDLGAEFNVNKKLSVVGMASVPYGLVIAARFRF